MGFHYSGEPFFYQVIRWIGFDGCGELIGREPRKFHQPVIHGAGVNIFSLGAGQHGSALVDHAREMDIARHLYAHAARKMIPQVHRYSNV